MLNFKFQDIDTLTEEEVKELIADVCHYDTMITNKIHSQQGKMTQAQCDQLISEHRRTMDAFNARLDRQRQRMGMVLSDKLAARMRSEDTFDEFSDDGDSEDDSEDEVSWELFDTWDVVLAIRIHKGCINRQLEMSFHVSDNTNGWLMYPPAYSPPIQHTSTVR